MPRNKPAEVVDILRPLIDALTTARLVAGLTQRQLAEAACLRQPALSLWETRQAVPTVPCLVAWADALGLELALLTHTPTTEETS